MPSLAAAYERLLEGGLGLEAHKGRGGFIFRRGEYAGAEVTASLSGIGKVNSAICAAAMIEEFDLDCLVSTGVCGTLRADGSIVQKDLILASSVIYHDVWCGTPNAFGQVQGGPPFYDLSLPGIRGLESALSGLGYTVHTGRMASGDWFVDSAQKAAMNGSTLGRLTRMSIVVAVSPPILSLRETYIPLRSFVWSIVNDAIFSIRVMLKSNDPERL